MKKLKNWLTVIMLITSVTVFSQTTLSGKVVDETNQPLPGASVIVKSSKIGATTDFDGNFSFDSSVNSGTLEVSFIGYESKLIAFKGKTNFGTVSLKPSAEALDEIVITQVSFAVDRKTPVAVSTIKAALIENKLGTQVNLPCTTSLLLGIKVFLRQLFDFSLLLLVLLFSLEILICFGVHILYFNIKQIKLN